MIGIRHSALGLFAVLFLAGPVLAQSNTGTLLLPSPPIVTPQAQQAPADAATPADTAAAPAQDAEAEAQALKDQQFQQALEQTFPLTPEQIAEWRKAQDDNLKAQSVPVVQGVPTSRSLRLTLKPGEESPVLRLQPGVVSTLTFSDITGKPWPVLSVVTGNPNAYVAQSAGTPGNTNIIVVSAVQPYTPSNMVVTLVGQAGAGAFPVPVTITLDQGQPQVDYRVDIQVANRGPNAVMDMTLGVALQPTNDSNMLAFLDGVPPEGAKRQKTSSSDVEAWAFGDMVYVRTRGDVLSPAYISRASNVSGVNIFVLHEAPVVIVSADGRMSSVRISR